MFTPELLTALKSEAGLLESLARSDLGDSHTLKHLTRLRKQYPAPLAAAALETARLRQKAAQKFQHAAEMFFTNDALQQATSPRIASYHADLLKPWGRIADLGCGIGGDSLSLGHHAEVIGLDYDLARLWMARHNAAVYAADATFIQADLTNPLPLKHIPAFFFDPARRREGQRIFSVEDYQPPLSVINGWSFTAGLVKLSPGVQLAELRDFAGGVEFISEDGTLKEALLHTGELAFSGRRATLINIGETLRPAGLDSPPVVDAPRRYLYEPDPAVIRAGLFGELLAHVNLQAYRIDETIAYLTGDTHPETAWLRAWEITDWMPFNLKKLKQYLVAAGVGHVTVKKRGSPLMPEELIKLLGLKGGGRHAVLTLTQIRGQHSVLMSLDH